MSLTACRECEHQVSTEAASCPHCGAGHPTGPPQAPDLSTQPLFEQSGHGIDYRNPLTYLVVIATVVVLAGGYFAYQHFAAGVTVSGTAMQEKIVEQAKTINPNAVIFPTCPSQMRLHKDKIVECTVRAAGAEDSQVFITPVDDSGHFHLQFENPSILIGQ